MKPLKDEFTKVEQKVEQASEKLDQLTALLVDPEVYADSARFQKLSTDHAKTKDRLGQAHRPLGGAGHRAGGSGVVGGEELE